MKILLLGTAAGGGFPQWNCNCVNCRMARVRPKAARPRTQSCIAVSADGTQWFLINASPDVRSQIESCPDLWPPSGAARGSGVAGVLLTNADLDHTLGLFLLREGDPLVIHASPAVRQSLQEGLALEAVLSRYCGLVWRHPPAQLSPLTTTEGTPTGLRYAAFPLPGKPPRYREGAAAPEWGDCVGYRIEDEATGGRLVVMPEMAQITAEAREEMAACDALLLDGTFWSEDEMRAQDVGEATAARMGHLPVGGPTGSLQQIAALPIPRKVYVHINNTNPMLLEDSPERAAVEAAGIEIGWDGQELAL